MHPVGPEEPAVYWKRRAIVGGVVLAFLLVAWLVIKPSGGDSQAEADNTAADTSAQADADVAAPAPTPNPVQQPAACADSDIEVTVSTDAEVYPVQSLMKLTMAITNSGTEPCLRDVGSASNEIVVTSGGIPVHSSDDCSTTDEADEKVLQPGQQAKVTVEWNGQITNAQTGCVSSGNPAQAGVYEVTGINGTVESLEHTFTLQ